MESKTINEKRKALLIQWLVFLSRLIVGGTFVFSGFVKAIDPYGTAYKFEDYFAAFHLEFLSSFTLLFSVALSVVEFLLGVHLLEKRRQRFCRCTLLWSKEKKAIMRGMFDSGNGLREPYGKRPVSIISEEWKERMEIGQKDLRLIPYHTVSGEHELMEITTVPEMILEQEGQTRRYTSVAVGFAKGQVFAGKSYGMILHREYME